MNILVKVAKRNVEIESGWQEIEMCFSEIRQRA
jgi:hypothetical protein